MADNIAVTPGSGANLKTDQGSSTSAHMQVVKLAESTDGGETLLPADSTYGLAVEIKKSITVATSPLAGQAWPVTDNGGNLSVDDGAGSLTVDAPAATPVAVRLSTGSAFIDTIPISDASGSITVDGTATVTQGTAAAIASAWPVKLTDGTSSVTVSTNALGVTLRDSSGTAHSESNPILVSPVRPLQTRVTKSVTLAASETGTTVWDPTTGTKFILTDLIISMSESGRITVFDQTNSAANIVFDGELYGWGIHLNFQARPWASSTIDNILKATTDSAAACTITATGYEI